MRWSVGVLATLIVAAACHGDPMSPDPGEVLSAEGQVGESTIRLSQTAGGLFEHRTEYDWTARRYVQAIHVGADMRLQESLTHVQILPGEMVWVMYYVEPRRHLASDATVAGVRGEVCITNVGSIAVGGLSIVARVQQSTGGSWTDVAGARSTMDVEQQIAAGAEECLPYEVLLSTEENVQYRVVATVLGPDGSAVAMVENAFTIPGAATETVIDELAYAKDGAYEACARDLGPDFSCTSTFSLPFEAEFSRTSDGRWTTYPEGQYLTMYEIDIRNEGVCGETFIYTIDEPLREGGPKPPGGQLREMPASLIITTGECEPPPPPLANCVLPDTYWIDHPDEAAALLHLPIFLGEVQAELRKKVSTAGDIAWYLGRQNDATNGINELYAQLLVTKINIARGANPTSIRETRNAVDVFVGAHDQSHWPGLTTQQRQQVMDWIASLRDFNEGRLGPPVCPGEPQGEGCTRTIGFWKNHAGMGPQADVVSALLPIWLGTANGAQSIHVTSASQAVVLLEMSGEPSNGINKLYAQLLAAKLNIENGASASAIADVIAAADAFLATRGSAAWGSLSKDVRSQVLGWMETLDDYNNGRLGPGHCS